MSFPKPYADAVAKLRVPGGFLMVAAFLWLSAPTWTSLALGLPVSVLGLALRAWAAGHLEKNRTLAESGPYAYVRNPLYIGTLAVAAGFVIASRRWELGSALRRRVPVDLPSRGGTRGTASAVAVSRVCRLRAARPAAVAATHG